MFGIWKGLQEMLMQQSLQEGVLKQQQASTERQWQRKKSCPQDMSEQL